MNNFSNLRVKVNKKLDENDADKEFKDFGDRVAGSRKEMSMLKSMTNDEVRDYFSDGKNQDTAFKFVNRKNIYPKDKLNFEKMKKNGFDAGVGFMLNKLYSAINKKPGDSPEERQKYTELVPKFFDKVQRIKSIEDLYTLSNNTWKNTESQKNIREIFGQNFYNLFFKLSKAAGGNWKKARSISKLTINDIKDSYDQYSKKSKIIYDDFVKNYDPYENYDSCRSGSKKGLEEHKLTSLYEQGVQMKFNFKKFRLKTLPFDRWCEEYDKKERDNDWGFLGVKRAISGERKKVTVRAHSFSKVSSFPREGGVETPAEKINFEYLKDEFGVKSIQYGNYVDDKSGKNLDRKDLTKAMIDSFQDLFDVTGVNIKRLNKLGDLNLALGARGKGSAWAHYEPGYKIINFTKTKGDGSFFHEYMHYLDNVLGNIEGKDRDKYISAGVSNNLPYSMLKDKGLKAINPEIYTAYSNLWKVIKSPSSISVISKTFQSGEAQERVRYPAIDIMYKDGGVEKVQDYLNEKYGNQSSNNKVLNIWKYLAKLHRDDTGENELEVDFKIGTSIFYNECITKGGKYWGAPTEIFSRCGEVYIHDKMKEKGIKNEYLAANNDFFEENAKMEGFTYPMGEEREKIFKAYDELFKVIKKTI